MQERLGPLPQLLSERQAANYLGISKPTLVRLRKKGVIKAKQIGRQWFYRVDWLQEYLDEADNQCKNQNVSRLDDISSTGGQTVPTGAPAGTTHGLDRPGAHHSAQAIFKRQRLS
jgi:excisionase family DNA binding protein